MSAQEDKGIYLGVFAGEGACESAPARRSLGEGGPVRLRYTGPKSVLCIAPSGAGKSMGLCVPNLADLPRSMIVIDPKGQLAAITARKRARMGRVIVLNPFAMFPELPHLKDSGWNPLRQLSARSPDFAGDARCSADAILSKSAGGGNSRFFEISAENLLALFVMAEAAKDRPDLNNIRLELASASLPQTLERMANCDVLPVRVAAGRLLARLTDQNAHNTSAQDVIDTVLKDMAFLDDPRMAFSMARGGAIEWGALHRGITTIFLVAPVHELTGNGAKLLRLFVNLALRGLYQNPPTSGATLPPVLFMLDEFGSCLGRLEEVIKALGAARDYSIQLFMVLQSLSQLKAHYEKEVSLFFAGAGAVACFAPAKDLDTAEHLAKIIGNREEMVQTETNSGGSLTPQAVPLIRPEDLMRLPRGMTANLIEPCPWPVLAHCPVYPQTPFADGLDDNPYYRG
jgi:type IV secretion system protein VirD4